MFAIDTEGELEKRAAEQLIAATTPFAGIENIRVDLGVDHTGDPSLWIIFRLRSGFSPDEAWVKAFSSYATDLCLKLIESGLVRFPYTRLERAA